MRFADLRLGMEVQHTSGKYLGPIDRIGAVVVHGRYPSGERWIATAAELEPVVYPQRIDGSSAQ